MSRLRPRESTLKKLFALSGNECAFTECKMKLVQDEGALVAQICHIEAENPRGARYNPRLSDEQKRAFKNLIIMCPNHHVIIDSNEDLYTVEVLRKMKIKHETNGREGVFEPTEKDFRRLIVNSGFLDRYDRWWLPTLTYSALTDIYPKECVEIYNKTDVEFVVRDNGVKTVIAFDVDSAGVNLPLLKLEQKLLQLDSQYYVEEIVCFLFCNGLFKKQRSRNSKVFELRKNAPQFFMRLNKLNDMLETKVSFVFLMHNFQKIKQTNVVPFPDSDGWLNEGFYNLIEHLDLAEHWRFQKVFGSELDLVYDDTNRVLAIRT